jgi:hypothetical protein
VVRQIMGQICTMQPVRVTGVTPAGTGAVSGGTVSIQPMVAMIDGAGNATPHGAINNVPYLRMQAGANAVIMDPEVGDIGIAVFAMRDISAVKNTQAPSNPGSRRQYDWADAVYLGGILNGTPTNYIQFSGGSISLTTPSASTSGVLIAGTGASGSFSTPTGQTVTVQDGIVTNIF